MYSLALSITGTAYTPRLFYVSQAIPCQDPIHHRPLRPTVSSTSSTCYGIPCRDSAPTPAVFTTESQIKNPVCSPLRQGTQERAQGRSRFLLRSRLLIVTCVHWKLVPLLYPRTNRCNTRCVDRVFPIQLELLSTT